MKLPCELIRDLLPLYHDGVSSTVSNTLVEAHLKECGDCRKALEEIDAELQVPETEREKAAPLVSIKLNWEKQSRRTKWKYICTGIGAFFLCMVLWWGLTQWCIVPLKGSDYIVQEVAQLENGVVHIEYCVMYRHAAPVMAVTQEGILYEEYRRPILEKRREQIPSGSAGIYLDPEDLTLGGETFSAYCLGRPDSKEARLLWEVGAELPAAGENTEEQYRQMEDSYTAPNAPEKPDPLKVIEHDAEPEENQGPIDWDHVEETVFPEK